MAFPDYFDRVSEGAAQVLDACDRSDFEARLQASDVRLAYDQHAATTSEGRAALDLCVRLLARLVPRLDIAAMSADHELTELKDLALAINPLIELSPARAEGQIAVVVGTTPLDAEMTVYLGSDRWIAEVSTTRPVGCRDSGNPFGAGAAACIAVANVFRALFKDWLEKPELDRSLRLSLLNHQTGRKAANADLPAECSMGEVQLAGAGAIGNAFIWALARVADLNGVLDVVDPERIELSNLQRYVLPERAQHDARKVELAGKHLAAQPRLQVRPHEQSWQEFMAQRGSHFLELVATALDSAKDRVRVQGSLPRHVVNAWTQPGDLGVSRHPFTGDHACLACLYLPSGKSPSLDELVAAELQIPESKLEIRRLLESGAPTPKELVREIALRAGVDEAALMPFAGMPLSAFRAKAVCGNAVLRKSSKLGADVQVPMAFQSAMAGVMLAAEVLCHALRLRSDPLPTKTAINLLRPVAKRPTVPVLKPTGPIRCICQDPLYVSAYAAKYNASSGLEQSAAANA